MLAKRTGQEPDHAPEVDRGAASEDGLLRGQPPRRGDPPAARCHRNQGNKARSDTKKDQGPGTDGKRC